MHSVVVQDCIRSCLLCELTASQIVAIATRSDTVSHNRLDLIQSLVPPHYVCNGYISLFSNVTLYRDVMSSPYLILDKHTIVDKFCWKWTCHGISHLRLRLRCDIALRNPFLQNKSIIVQNVYISVIFLL